MNSAAIIAPASEEQGGSALVSVHACLTARRPGVPCTACGAACPEGAIRIAERSVSIDPAACSGCGRCTVACPTGALSVPAFRPAGLYECARARRSERGADIVPCLGGLSPAVLRAGLMEGDVTLIDRGWCASCLTSGGKAEPWAEAVRMVNAEAEALGIGLRVRVRREPRARWRARAAPKGRTDNPARRALFARLAQAGRVSKAPTDPLAGLPGQVAAPGPQQRAAQLASLSGSVSLPGALFPALSVTGALRDLRGLARPCPTAALSVTEGDGHEALTFDATACGDCTQTGALTLSPAGDALFTGPRALARQAIATCTRCRARFAPKAQETICDGCTRDTDLAALAHGLRRR